MKIFCFLLTCLCWMSVLFGQPGSNMRETGRRLMRNYPPKEHNGRTQNREIIRDERGLLYVANGAGVLEYDGVEWRVIPMSNQGMVLSLSLGEQNRIFVGGEGEMGYLGPDSVGYLVYHSLKHILPDSLQDFRYLHDVHTCQGDVFFQSSHHLFHIQQDSLQLKNVWSSQGFINVYEVNDQIYVFTQESKLRKLEGDRLVPLDIPPNVKQYGLLPTLNTKRAGKTEELLFAGPGDNGKYSFQLYNGTTFCSLPLEEEVISFFSQSTLRELLFLEEQGYLVVSNDNGALVLDSIGRVLEVLNQEYGLEEDLNEAYLDHQGLWMSKDYGLLRVEPFSPFSMLGAEEQLDGAPRAVIKHQGDLYVGTSNGFFRMIPSSRIGQAVRFEEIGDLLDVFAFHSDGETLLIGSYAGLFQFKDGTLTSSNFNPAGTGWDTYILQVSTYDSTILYQGTSSGVRILKKTAGRWQLMGEIDLPGQVRSILEEGPDTLWLGTIVLGLNRFVFSDRARWTIEQEKADMNIEGELRTFSQKEGIPPGLVYVWQLADRMVLTTTQGLKRLDSSRQSFVPEPYFGEVLADSNTFTYLAVEDAKARIYILTDYNISDPSKRVGISTLTPNAEGNYHFEPGLFHRLPPSIIYSIQSVYAEPDNPDILWLTGEELIRYDASKAAPMPDSFPVYLRWLTANRDSVVYWGYEISTAPMELEYAYNTFRFEYAAPFLQGEEETRYQVMLEGLDEEWSAWSDETYADYTNLREGSYRFRVRARNIAYTISESTPFELVILPPWYRTWWAYALYALLALMFTLFMASLYNKWRMRKILAKNLELETIVDMRTEEIQDKNQQLNQTLSTLKDTQNQLIMQEKMASLGQMATGVAHEIKNPLNFIHNFSLSAIDLAKGFKEDLEAYLQSKDPKDLEFLIETAEGLKENAEGIFKHEERATQIVKGMMKHAGGSGGERLPTQLNTLVEEAIQLAYQGYRAENESFHVQIDKHLANELPLIEINPQDIRRIIINLVNNACYAMDRQAETLGQAYVPTLTIETKEESKGILLSIRDNGTGIPQDIKNQIFQPFFTTKPTGKGNIGLGLSMTYDMITQGYLGKIDIESQVGAFTEFRIWIPLSNYQEV